VDRGLKKVKMLSIFYKSTSYINSSVPYNWAMKLILTVFWLFIGV